MFRVTAVGREGIETGALSTGQFSVFSQAVGIWLGSGGGGCVGGSSCSYFNLTHILYLLLCIPINNRFKGKIL